MADFVSREKTIESLREAAALTPDMNDVDAIESLADHLESTFDYFARAQDGISERVFLAELAEAFRAGYEYATGDTAREIGRAQVLAGIRV